MAKMSSCCWRSLAFSEPASVLRAPRKSRCNTLNLRRSDSSSRLVTCPTNQHKHQVSSTPQLEKTCRKGKATLVLAFTARHFATTPILPSFAYFSFACVCTDKAMQMRVPYPVNGLGNEDQPLSQRHLTVFKKGPATAT